MSPKIYAIAIDLLFSIGGVIVVLPIVVYLARIWAKKRDKIFAYLSDGALVLYYQQFYPGAKPGAGHEQEQFRKDFGKLYGRRHYVIPLLILAGLTALSGYMGARTVQAWQGIAPGKYTLPWIVASALAGAFVWVINDFTDRLRRRDLAVPDIYRGIFRVLIAAPFGWAFAQLAAKDVGVPLAFILGAFPTGTLFTIARRLAANRLGVADDPDSGKLELEDLQSVNKTNAERYYDEGIATIVQLAYADPVDLTFRTNFDFNYVIDCISQALLWMYFGDKTKALAIYSLRGAQEAAFLVDALRNDPPQQQATATLNAVAAALNLQPDALRTTLEQVANDPYCEFLCEVWH